MTKMYAKVHDKGNTYLINEVFIADDNRLNLVIGTEIIEITNSTVFGDISEALFQKKIVQLPKGIESYTTADLIVDELDELESAKYAGIIQIKNTVNSRIGNTYTYDFFKFQLSNNILGSAGFIITDSNREEKYLEILETGDEELIGSLETYLNILDKISEHLTLNNQVNLVLEEIEMAGTVDEVITQVNGFLSSLN